MDTNDETLSTPIDETASETTQEPNPETNSETTQEPNPETTQEPEPESLLENTPTDEKKTKKKKEQFSAECDHCNKIFKNKITYEKHTIHQLCYSQDEITYCKICSDTLQNHNDYKKHLFTMKHLNNIGYNNIERLQNKEISKVHLADPYLNKTDINTIANTNLGDSFTFVFTKGNTKTISLVNTIQDTMKESSQTSIQESSQALNDTTELQDGQDDQYSQNSNIEYNIRQMKIISFLEKLSSEQTPGDSGKQFYKLLDNKLQIEDFKGLQNIINNLQILDNYKNTYSKVVEIFITMLVKEKNKGEKLYKNKDISQLVINLTS